MKTMLPLLMVSCLALSAAAQPAPPQFAPPAPPDTNAPALDESPQGNAAPGSNALLRPPPTVAAAPPPGAVPPNRPVTPRAAGRNPISPVPVRPSAAVPAAPPPAADPANPGTPPATLAPPPAAQPGPPPAGGPAPVASATPAPQEEFVATEALDWSGSGGADLETVFDVYSKLTGRTILRPANLKSEPIKFRAQTPLTHSEAIQALNSVLALNAISMIPVGDKFVKAVPKAQAIAEGAPLQRLDSTNLLELGPFVQHIVQLEYVKPSEIQPLLTMFASLAMANAVIPIDGSMTLVLRDNMENVKRMLEVVKEVDRAVPAEFISEVIPIKYAMAADIASALGSLSSGGAVTSSGSSGRTSGTGAARTGSTANRFGMGGLQGQQGANPYGAAQPGQLGQPGAQPSFSDRLNQIIKKASTTGSGDVVVLGPTKIVSDERANSLLVFASKTDMSIITNIVAKLDVVLPQVLIETIIISVSLSDGKSMGVSYLQQPQQVGSYFTGAGALNNVGFMNLGTFSGATNGLGSLGNGLSYFGRFGQDFDATITAAASDSRITVIQKPRIMTFHAKPASFFIGSTVPYVTQTSYYGGYGGYGGPSSQYQQLKVGIGLDVTPYINQDGLVVMEINQQIEEIDGYTEIANVGKVPNTASKTLSAQVAVKDRETIILGGFIRTSDSKNNDGVPILKDIPLLGFLFNKSSKSNERKELIVLMRPTVLRTPELAAATTTEEKLRLPGISEAERKDKEVEDRTAERMKRRLSEQQAKQQQESEFRDVSPDWKPGK